MMEAFEIAGRGAVWGINERNEKFDKVSESR